MSVAQVPGASGPTSADESHPNIDRLRHFCLAILSVLNSRAGAGSIAAALPTILIQAFGAGVEEIVVELRRDVDRLATAVASLRGLSSRYLALPATASTLLTELEETHTQANQLAEALDAIRLGMPLRDTLPGPGVFSASNSETPSTHLLPETTGLGELPRNPVSTGTVGSTPIEEEAIQPILRVTGTAPTETHELTQSAVPLSPTTKTQRARLVFFEAELYRKQREFDRAEELYTEVILIDPRFGPAYSRRGQARLARHAIHEAIADFDAALVLNDTAAEAWWWRGDAHAINGQLDEAIDDYTRALALRPDLERARSNLAIAKRRKTEAMTTAVSSTPTLALESASAETQTTPSAPTSDPVSHSSKTASKKAGGHLTVSCPHCAEIGEIPWDRLGKVFACKACGHRFGVGVDGKAVEVTEAPGGKWVEASKVREQARRRRKRRLMVVAVLGCAILFPAIGVAGWQAIRPAKIANAEVELPKELDARAELFCRAWLANDVRLMKRLTSPTHDKIVYSWYTRHRPPLTLHTTTDGVLKERRVEVQIQLVKSGHARVRLLVSDPSTSGNQPPFELTLLWEEHADGWYFLPPSR